LDEKHAVVLVVHNFLGALHVHVVVVLLGSYAKLIFKFVAVTGELLIVDHNIGGTSLILFAVVETSVEARF
jgi:hypothetical protein